MTFVIDIDETILFSEREGCEECGRVVYKFGSIDKKEINLINRAYDKGHIIILYTGRGWDYYELTKNQLAEAKVQYHELIMGKPIGIHIDKDAKTTMKGLI